MSDAVASAVDALDAFDVSYETTPTDTVIEADDSGEVFAAAEAAHRAVADHRVITSLEVDDQRTRTQRLQERVASVERKLGRPPKRDRQRQHLRAVRQERRQRVAAGSQRDRRGRPDGEAEPSESDAERYGGPWRSENQDGGSPRTKNEGRGSQRPETGGKRPRYLSARRPVSR